MGKTLRLNGLAGHTGIALLAACLLTACGTTSKLESVDAGRTVVYEPGLPNFDMEAIATWRDGVPGIDLNLGIPPHSLVFLRRGDGYEARYELLVRVEQREGREIVREILRQDTVRMATYEETQSVQSVIVRERVEVAPGAYVVSVMVTDLNSDKQAGRRQAVDLSGAAAGQPHISHIRLEAYREDGGMQPVVSLHVPAFVDSLRSVVEIYNVIDPVDVSMRLLRFVVDTTVAAPPHWISPTRGSVEYRGILYERADTLQVSRRRLEDIDGEAVVEFDLPELGPGFYRLTLMAQAVDPEGGAEHTLLERTREFSVKSGSFPRIERLAEMVEALSYIAYEEELAPMRAAETPAEMKRLFDAFWGSIVPNRQAAANLVELYYGRVEEANLYFTAYKEGWKTDRGMVYIVLGPPLQVDTNVREEIWYYSYSDQNPGETFVFEKVNNYRWDDPFDVYILQRRPYYHYPWIRAVDRWRDGEVN